MAIHIIFFILYAMLSGTLDAISINALLLVHCAISMVYEIRVKKRGLHFMMMYYIGASISTLANIYYLSKIATFGVRVSDIYFYIVLEYIEEASALWAMGNAFIFIGYELFAKRQLPPVTVEIKNERVLDGLFRFIIIMSLLNFTGNAVNLSFITGGLQKILSLMNLMGILFFARLWVVDKKVRYRNYAIILCLAQTVIALYTSFLRLDLLTPMLSFFGGYFIGKANIRYLLSYRLVIPLGMLMFFSSFFNTLGGNRAHFITAFTEEQVTEPRNTSYVDLSTSEERGGVLERGSNIAQLSNIVNLVERKGIYGGTASLPLLAALIPRFLWPDKPQIQLGAWFALEIGAATISTNGVVNNSVNMSVPGELYLDFGYIGLLLGCLLFGGLLALFWNAAEFLKSAHNLTGALWGGYLLLYGFIGIGADLQIVISLLSTYLMFIIIKNAVKSYAGVLGRSVVAR